MHVGGNGSSARVYEQMNFNTLGKGSNRAIDSNLLKEAFAYTDQLLKEAVIEEVETSYLLPGNHQILQSSSSDKKKLVSVDDAYLANLAAAYGHGTGNGIANPALPRSAPNDGNSNSNTSLKKQKKSSGNINAIRQLKSNRDKQKTATTGATNAAGGIASGVNMNTNNFVTANDSMNVDYKRNVVNFDELVANFQQGTTLERLKAELAASQQSLQQSESSIRELSGHYLQQQSSSKKSTSTNTRRK